MTTSIDSIPLEDLDFAMIFSDMRTQPPSSSERTSSPSKRMSSPPPPPPPTFEFQFKKRKARTTVIFDESLLSSHLSDFLVAISRERQIKRIVGLDIQTVYFASPETSRLTGKVAILNLFSGRSGLPIHLISFKYIPSSLAAFLDLPDLVFAGVGMMRCMSALQKDYGLQCRNIAELGDLAASVRSKPFMPSLGLADLAADAGLEYSVEAPDLAFCAETLTDEQVMSVNMSAFLSFHIGNQLLGGRSLEKSELPLISQLACLSVLIHQLLLIWGS